MKGMSPLCSDVGRLLGKIEVSSFPPIKVIQRDKFLVLTETLNAEVRLQAQLRLAFICFLFIRLETKFSTHLI